MAKVMVIAGSASDSDLLEKVAEILEDFHIGCETQICSAHRDPERLKALVEKSDAKVFIAIAGLSAALPGVIASHTTRPVIGLPREVKLGGLDALLSIAQMPPGVPVGTVGIENPKNAALLAVEILALEEGNLRERLEAYREGMRRRA
jgi:5-(carboxyamino)imidazole ribonucleotide mutase